MAEGFARRYGSDVMHVESAGLAPASIVQPLTKKVMEAKNINIDEQYPKDLTELQLSNFDMIVNMSGSRLPTRTPGQVRDWTIEDPIGKSEETYTKICNQIESQVMHLILELRRAIRRTTRPTETTGSPSRRD